jgi:hypothetical protein
MGFARLRDRVHPPFIVLLTALLVTAVIPAPFSAAPAPARPDCRFVSATTAARAALSSSSSASATVTVRAQLNASGELVGRSLAAQAGTSSPIAVALPNESFVGEPAGDIVIYTRYSTATGSEVRALNPVTRCDIRLVAPPEIVRSAILDKLASGVFVHSVTKASRADAGVARYDLQTGDSAQVVPPLAASDSFGPIFGTALRWSADGNALAVQSCGLSACLTRVLDVATGQLSIYDFAGQGGIISLTATHLVTYAACAGLPCAVLSADLRSGEVTTLAASAFDVNATSNGSAVALSISTTAGTVEVVQ